MSGYVGKWPDFQMHTLKLKFIYFKIHSFFAVLQIMSSSKAIFLIVVLFLNDAKGFVCF